MDKTPIQIKTPQFFIQLNSAEEFQELKTYVESCPAPRVLQAEYLESQNRIVFYRPLQLVHGLAEQYTQSENSLFYAITKRLDKKFPDADWKEQCKRGEIFEKKFLDAIKKQIFLYLDERGEEKSAKITIPKSSYRYAPHVTTPLSAEQIELYTNDQREYTKKQKTWASFSHETVQQLRKKIKNPGPKNLLEILTWLGCRRQQIAIELEHGNCGYNAMQAEPWPELLNQGRDQFGLLREAAWPFLLSENFVVDTFKKACYFPSKPTQRLFFNELPPEPKPYIVEYDFVKESLLDKLKDEKYFKQAKKEGIQIYQQGYENLFSCSKSPEEQLKKDKPPLFIRVEDGSKYAPEPGQYLIRVVYPMSSPEDIEKLQPYLDKVLAETEETKVLEALGELAYHLFRKLPYYRGSAGIVETLVRGIAEEKGFQLGPKGEKPLDWKAYFTFSENEYGKWFAQEAFQKPLASSCVLF